MGHNIINKGSPWLCVIRLFCVTLSIPMAANSNIKHIKSNRKKKKLHCENSSNYQAQQNNSYGKGKKLFTEIFLRDKFLHPYFNFHT